MDGNEQFHRDPRAFYEALRAQHGSLAPVELAPGVPATLVLGYRTALAILNDPEHFLHDSRTWQESVPTHSTLRPMMASLDAARYRDGTEHDRYRRPSRHAIDGIALDAVHDKIEPVATMLVDSWLPTGNADLAGGYAFPLVTEVMSDVLGCPPEIRDQVAAGTAERFNSDATAEHGMKMLADALTDLAAFKTAHPGDDVTTRLIQHPVQLETSEVVAQLMSFVGAALEATPNLICNALLVMLTDSRFGGSLLGGSLATRDALDEALFNEPPMANFCITYTRQPILIEHVWLPAHQPVVISIAACHADPAVQASGLDGTARWGNRSHLAFGLGPHACPARHLAYLLAEGAIIHLLDLVPDIELAVPVDQLVWRPGIFQRAVTALPVTFPRAPRSGAPQNTEPPTFPMRRG